MRTAIGHYSFSALLAVAALSGNMLHVTFAESNFPPPQDLPSQSDFPDPLVTLSGKKVATVSEWEGARKPELKALFQHYMYGRYPARPEKVSGKTLFTDTAALGGKGTLREVEIAFGPPD